MFQRNVWRYGIGIFVLYAVSLPAMDLPQLRRAAAEGLTYIRVALIASDEELPHVWEAIEEAEHALEPPAAVEGFWKRKWHILYRLGADTVHPFFEHTPPRALYRLLWENPPAAFDLRRSFQNSRRLLRLSEDFASPWLRQLMLNSATMFAITHGGEFFTGSIEGTHELFRGNVAAALAWYGLAIPGLYDFGCWIGQGLIVLKPTRAGFDILRRATILVAGKAVQYVGLKRVVQLVFERPEVRAQMAQLARNGTENKQRTTFEIYVEDEALLRYSIIDNEGGEALRLRFEINDRGEMVLCEADVHEASLVAASYASLKHALGDFGWNVLGAFRQIHKLLCRNQADLISSEKTFISGSHAENGFRHLVFRPNAVSAHSRLRLSDALRGWWTAQKQCVLEMLRYYSPVVPLPPPPAGIDAE
ncbi:MAG: hypothetical protein KDD51_11710 [Bdellovibrionales bacterium]|nr:hypothetical protein [Bdellovibrionales bacterium]